MGTAFENYDTPPEYICKKCGESRPSEQFQLHGKYWDTTCKLCRKDEVREWQKNNPDRMAANNKRWLKRTIAKAHEVDQKDATIATLTRRLELADEALEAGITVMEALADIVDAATKDKKISRNLQGLAWMVDRSDRAVTVWRDKLKAFREGADE